LGNYSILTRYLSPFLVVPCHFEVFISDMALLSFFDNIKITTGKPLDSRYLNLESRPYSGTSEVNATIPIQQRYIGLTTNINNAEYWYATGVTNSDLIVKSASLSLNDSLNFWKTSGITTIISSVTINGNTNTGILLQTTNGTTNHLSGLSIQPTSISMFEGVIGARRSLNFNSSQQGIQVVDQLHSKGMVYNADYSVNYTDRSLIDKGFAKTQLIDRTTIAYSSSTINLNLDSLEQKRFIISNISGDVTLSFSNITNVDFFSVDFSASTTVNITMPSTVRMQSYEVNNGRWNATTRVITVSAGLYTLTFSYDGSLYRVNCSDQYI